MGYLTAVLSLYILDGWHIYHLRKLGTAYRIEQKSYASSMHNNQ